MKKTIYALVTGSFLFLATTNHVNAQQKSSVAFNEAKEPGLSGVPGENLDLSRVVEVKLGDVAAKAQKDFAKSFKQAEQIKWYKLDDGFIASFNQHGTAKRSNYDQKGNWRYSMATYTEEKLPLEVRSQVKTTYYDFAITLVNEIKTREKIIYIVHMTDKTSWINLRVCEGEMEVIERYSKSN
jgi:hypothetical protein